MANMASSLMPKSCDAKIVIAAPVADSLCHLVNQTGAKVQYSGVEMRSSRFGVGRYGHCSCNEAVRNYETAAQLNERWLAVGSGSID